MWLSSALSHVRRTANAIDVKQDDDNHEEDGVCVMGHPAKRGPNKRQRETSDRRRRRTARATSSALRMPPWRENKGDRGATFICPKLLLTYLRKRLGRMISSSPKTPRRLLTMDESGPGTDIETTKDRPLDLVQCENIVNTLHSLPPHAQLVLLSGFTCFIQELTLQVMSMFVTGASVYDDEADADAAHP